MHAARSPFAFMTWILFVMAAACAAFFVFQPLAGSTQEGPKGPLLRAEGLLLEGDIEGALPLLEEAVKGGDRERALYRLASTYLTADRPAEARDALGLLMKEFPGGPYFHKGRFLEARALRLSKDFEGASGIYQAEVARLLSRERKEEVAQFYIKYAESLKDPKREGGPQLAKAVELYRHALDLEIPGALDGDLRLEIAGLLHELKDHGQEEKVLAEFKKRYPESNLKDEVDFRLARARLAMNRHTEARRAFRQFLTDHPTSPRVPEVHYGIARTYKMPKPDSDQALALGVKALEDFLAAASKSDKAPKAIFDMATAYLHRGRYDDAVAAYERLIAEYGEKEGVTELPEARYNLARAFLKQARFGNALGALSAFLVEHAAHHLWDDAQRLIVDAEYAWCLHRVEEKEYDRARTQFETFCLKHPLDARTPQAYFALGALEKDRENYHAAVTEWERLAAKYPDSREGSQARFMIGWVRENRLADLDGALEAYRKVTGAFQGMARQRIDRMQEKSLMVLTERAFTTKEEPRVKISTRNIESLAFRAYKVDLEDYFLKRQGTDRVEDLDIDLIEPDREWTSEVKDFVKYGEISWEEKLPFASQGAYLLNVSDGERTATALVMVTDLEMILKSGREDLLVFVEDVAEKKPFEGAEILVSDGKKVLFKGHTGPDGVFHRPDKALAAAGEVRVLVASGGHYASNALNMGNLAVAEGLSPKAYLFTDRTVYRPGSEIHLKGFVREVDRGRYFFEENAAYALTLTGPAGNEVFRSTVGLNAFGGLDETVRIDDAAPVGTYRFNLKAPTGWSRSVTFPVLKYEPPRAEITVKLDRDVFHPGEKIEGSFLVTFSYGEPVRDRALRYQYGTGIRIDQTTDEKGEVPFTLDARDFAESGTYTLIAEVPSENASIAKVFHFSTTGFDLSAQPSRDVILAGEDLTLNVKAVKPGGDPAGAEGELRVLRLVEEQGVVAEREIDRLPWAIDGEQGQSALKISLEEGGRYRFRAAAKDRFGNLVTADCEAFVSGEKDDVKLRLFADRVLYDAGEEAEVGLHLRCDANLALLTHEGERIFTYRVVPLKAGMNRLPLTMDSELAPNFTFAAALMDGNRLHAAQVDLKVRSSLKVAVKPAAERAGPGETVDVELSVTDRKGRPVEGEFALALVDSALLARFPDTSDPIHEYFFGRERKGRLETVSSCTFSYKARVKAIDRALLDEMERRQWAQAPAEDAALNLEGLDLRALVEAELNEDAIEEEVEESESAYFANNRRVEDRKAVTQGGLARRRARKKSKELTAGARFKSESKDSSFGRELDKEALNKLSALGYNGGGGGARRPGPGGPSTPGPQLAGKADFLVQYARGAVIAGDRIELTEGEATALRRRFLETAYWNPSVRTGPDGKARVSVTLPDNITSWRVLARGLGREAAGGQGKSRLVTEKRLFANLEAPRRLVEGDKTQIRSHVVNTGENPFAGKLRLKVDSGGEESVHEKTIEIPAGGDRSVAFPFTAGAPGTVRLDLEVLADAVKDRVVERLDVMPFGVAMTDRAGGAASESATARVALPSDRSYSTRALEITVGPSHSDFLLDMAMGGGVKRYFPTNTDLAARLAVRLCALETLRRTGMETRIRAEALEDRIREDLTALLLVRHGSGAFPWIKGRDESLPATGEALKALVLAKDLGFNVPEDVLVKTRDWMRNRLRTLNGVEKLYGLHAVARAGKPDFTELNRFYRSRNQLDANALGLLALAFLEGGYKDQAKTCAALLADKGVFDETSSTVETELRRKAAISSVPWLEDPVLVLALAVESLARTVPGDSRLAAGAERLMKRLALRWPAGTAKAAGAAALCRYLGEAALEKARYRLALAVNGKALQTLEVDGPSEVRVFHVAADRLNTGENRVDFAFEGRGRYTYAVKLTGFTAEVKPLPYNAEHPLRVTRKCYMAPLTYKGREVPVGFNTVTLGRNEKTWDHPLEGLSEGEVGIVRLSTDHYKDYCRSHATVITDFLPAGCTVVESGIEGNFSHYELGRGSITFYVPQGRARIAYPVYGAFRGAYRAPPTVVRSLHTEDLFAHGETLDLDVRGRGVSTRKAYRMTPDELYHLGAWHHDDGDLEGARDFLSEFMERFTPREKQLVDGASRLFKIAYKRGADRDLIRYFELLRERAPSLILSFQESARVASAYRNAGEFEQALELMAMIAGANFSRESRVAEALEKQGEFLGAMDYMVKLIRTYPDLSRTQTALFALSQRVLKMAGPPGGSPQVKGPTRMELITRGLGLVREFLVAYPSNPVADEAAYSLISTFLDLEQGDEVAKLCPIFRARWEKSRLRSSMEYAEAFALFETGRYEDAQGLLTRVADRPDRGLAPAEKDDRDLARYILGQIEHARGRVEAALARYGQVKTKFEDANEAMAYFTRKSVSLPEVSTFPEGEAVKLDLSFRNVPEVSLSVYKVDLMKLYLARKSLNAITDINLAGIEPILSRTYPLGDGKDYRDRKKPLNLPLEDKGAYLLVVQGDEASCSGMVLVSDLKLEVQEAGASGRVRVNVKDVKSGEFHKNVHIKVIGSANDAFRSGYTDLRGIFVADDVSGTSAVIAERDGEYGFHRGEVVLQAPQREMHRQQQDMPAQQLKQQRGRALQNVFKANVIIQDEGQQVIEELYKHAEKGVQIK